MEGCGNAVLTVVRAGPELDRTCFIDYKTLDGTASATADFEYTEGTLCFKVSRIFKNIYKYLLSFPSPVRLNTPSWFQSSMTKYLKKTKTSL